jgi:hypothetical protein
MEKTVKKAAPRKVTAASKPKVAKRKISEQDIRARAFEIYHSNMDSTSNAMDHWLYAEKELEGNIK